LEDFIYSFLEGYCRRNQKDPKQIRKRRTNKQYASLNTFSCLQNDWKQIKKNIFAKRPKRKDITISKA
jgi:hypothetical protein